MRSGAGRAAVHRGAAPARRGADRGRSGAGSGGGQVHHQLRGVLGLVLHEQVEVGELREQRRPSGVDPVRVDDDAGLLRLAEDLGQPHPRHRFGGQQIAQHLAGADARQLVDVADQQQVRARRHRLGQLVREQDVQHRGLVHHDRSASSGAVLVVGRVAAGLELQQPVHGGGLGAGELGQAVWRRGRWARPAAPWRPWPAASSITERTVKDLPQPGPPVSTATFSVSASRTACSCSGASVGAGALAQPRQAPCPTPRPGTRRSRSSRCAAGDAVAPPARPRRGGTAPGRSPRCAADSPGSVSRTTPSLDRSSVQAGGHSRRRPQDLRRPRRSASPAAGSSCRRRWPATACTAVPPYPLGAVVRDAHGPAMASAVLKPMPQTSEASR